MIIFDMENENGFYCVYLFLLASYIYSRKINEPLYIKDNNWKFLCKNGLDDYFILNTNIIKYDESMNINSNTYYKHLKVPNIKITLNDYMVYSKQLYMIKPTILNNYDLPDTYNSIFMRGGDKLLYEAKQLPISDYVNKLLEVDNHIKNVFVHSDDNLLVDKVKQYIKDNNIDLQVYNITNADSNGGAVVMKRLKYGKCKNINSVDDMNNEEVKEHTILMLNAIEIMRRSKNVVTSFDSNVSRFMKINFDCNVFSINGNNNLDLNKYIKNPAYGFT
tara:strand:+ start:5586 stop:6413 length:828 start_codon:yes stop_codon:yes gene_type:complete